MVFDVDGALKKVFASIVDGEQTDRYKCLFAVCENPTCSCRHMHMTFVPEPSEREQGYAQRPERKASIDLDIQGVDSESRKTASDEDLAFAETLVGQMTDRDFHVLGNLHFGIKNAITEKAAPDSIDPGFDFTDIESDNLMQVYNGILPFGDRFLIDIDGVDHILLDQFCVRVGCDCTETSIEIVRMSADGNPGGHVGTVSVDYRSKQWQPVAGQREPRDLLALRQSIENEIPDFYVRLSRRHAKLQAIYAHCRKRHLATWREARTMFSKKVGRNDPCPCGSGEKYKKCCLQ